MDSFVLGSGDGSARLEFSDLERDHHGTADRLKATITDVGLVASARVVFNTHINDASALATMFEEIAGQWRGWDGTRQWQALESPFRLCFTHDGIGHIRAEVTLGSGFYPEDWSVKACLILEPGALEELAPSFRRFLEQ